MRIKLKIAYMAARSQISILELFLTSIIEVYQERHLGIDKDEIRNAMLNQQEA